MTRIHLSQANVTEVEESFVLDALRSGWVAPLGPHVDAFEAELAARVGVRGALALSSGTAALHLALLDAGAGPGTVVPVSTMTFAASANAIVYTGAEPVFVDAHESDGNVDVDLLIEAVDTLRAEGRDVPAVMTVDLFGRCANYSNLEPALAERGVALIEDAAEALGAAHNGRQAGSFGRCAALSFNGNKILTTSGGGALLSNDLDLLARARHLATQAREPLPWYEHHEVGYNYRLSNILAALGRGQLVRFDDMLARRRDIRRRYAELLSAAPGIRFLGGDPDRSGSADNCWLTTIVFDSDSPRRDALSIAETMAEQGIEVRPLWKPMHLQKVFASHRRFITGVSESLFAHGLALPSGAGLTDSDIDTVADVLLHRLSA